MGEDKYPGAGVNSNKREEGGMVDKRDESFKPEAHDPTKRRRHEE